MTKVLENLKDHHIINPQNVNDLKSYIKNKYPDDSSKHTATILANAIHRIIDENIIYFDQPIRNDIRHHLIENTIKKDSFSISAYEVFKVCSSLNVADTTYLDHLTTWINHNQSLPVSKEEVLSLVNSFSVSRLTPQLEPQNVAIPLKKKWFPNLSDIFKNVLSNQLASFALTATFVLTSPIFLYIIYLCFKPYVNPSKNITYHTVVIHSAPIELVSQKEKIEHNLPIYLSYKKVNKEALKSWLHQKNSLLSEDPYFNSIINTAKDYNINPFLLFAIAGQEQGFVPKSKTHAKLMANNPFNVFESWRKYNTHIDDSSAIVTRTIINLSKDCPEDEDVLKWINRKYAADPNWHKGVSQILTQLEKEVGMHQ